ncbi:hypothetical protein BaRGS_00024347 [Batillaria attramentaria]|uniref:Uncharacterized protein n=1 Tax=Batillaria attramentaria TaxID=370345 RepID=A0ABD0KBK3_9CAEN
MSHLNQQNFSRTEVEPQNHTLDNSVTVCQAATSPHVTSRLPFHPRLLPLNPYRQCSGGTGGATCTHRVWHALLVNVREDNLYKFA